MVLELHLTTIGLLVERPGAQGDERHDDEREQAARNAGVQTRTVARLILDSEDETSCDTADTAHSNEGGRAESSLPLAADVVRLVRHGGWDVAVGASGCQEDSEVADVGVAVETHDGEADEAEDHVEHDDGSAEMVLVASPAGCVHDDGGQCVGWSDEALRCAD